MDKKALTEQDIRSKFISPAIHVAGWDAMRQVREEVQLTIRTDSNCWLRTDDLLFQRGNSME